MLPLLLLIVLSLIWGSSFILMKIGLYAFSWDVVASLRLTFSMCLLFPFLLPYLRKTSRKDMIWLCIGGLIGNGIPAFLFPAAETVLPSAIAGVLNSLSPLFVLVTGWLIFRVKLPGVKIAGVFVGLAGAILMALLSQDESQGTTGLVFYAGIVVFATFLYGLSTNISGHKMRHLAPVQIAGSAFLFTGLPASIWLFTGSDFGELMRTHPLAWQSFAAVAVLSAAGSALALVLYYRLLQISGPASASSVTYLMPIVALVWGLYSGERLVPLHLVGMAVIITGVYLVNYKNKKIARPSGNEAGDGK